MVSSSGSGHLGRRFIVGIAATLVFALLSACGSATTTSRHATGGHRRAIVAVAKPAGITRPWPTAGARVVGTIRATLPADDNVIEYRSILLAAYRKACPDVTSVSAQLRPLHPPKSELILVQCGNPGSATRVAVRVVYTGVRVPDMLGPTIPELQGVTNRIGLRLAIRYIKRNAEARVIREEPRPGTVVAFGTTVRIVIASDAK
jgi:hypothetical protein